MDVTMQRARYVRLFADAHGESHFDDVEIELAPVDFAPPAPPLNVASLFPASRCSVIGGAPRWAGGIPHPSPRRQVFCTMQGEYEVTVSDGTTRRFPKGSLLLLEDTFGKGHASRILDELLILAVTLEDE